MRWFDPEMGTYAICNVKCNYNPKNEKEYTCSARERWNIKRTPGKYIYILKTHYVTQEERAKAITYPK